MAPHPDGRIETDKPPTSAVMAAVSRRGFLSGAASMGVGVALATSIPGAALLAGAEDEAPEADIADGAMAEPLVAQVRDAASGEISIMSGMREVVVKDTQLVQRLLRAMIP